MAAILPSLVLWYRVCQDWLHAMSIEKPTQESIYSNLCSSGILSDLTRARCIISVSLYSPRLPQMLNTNTVAVFCFSLFSRRSKDSCSNTDMKKLCREGFFFTVRGFTRVFACTITQFLHLPVGSICVVLCKISMFVCRIMKLKILSN